MTPAQLPSSALRARNLLAAWNTGDLARLESALDQHSYNDDVHVPAIEREKSELIDEAVQAMRGFLTRSRSENDIRAALKLLRHVGRCDDVRLAR